jgi:hypothetical protein
MTPVEILYEEYRSIVSFLNESSQPSLASDVNKYFKKVIALSAASFFEHKIQEILLEFVARETNNNPKIVSFFKKKAIGMQYHTYFVWGEKDNPDNPGKNANSFFSLFGQDFRKQVESEIKADVELGKIIKSFLEIGHLRNILIHSNFAAYNLENKTTEEIFSSFILGLPFIEYLREKLKQQPHKLFKYSVHQRPQEKEAAKRCNARKRVRAKTGKK